MVTANQTELYNIRLSKKDFKRLSDFIHINFGIKMPLAKKGMMEGRLAKRLRALKISTFKDYCEYLFSPNGLENEIQQLINVITTNKTDFFREPNHFRYLIHTAVPFLLSTAGIGTRRPLHVWSCACSRGDEPYTLSMVLTNFAEMHPQLIFNFSILATDISTKALEEARMGVYPEEFIEPVPIEFRKKYLLKSKDPQKKVVRIAPAIRGKVSFQWINLMDEDYGINKTMDIIFCRNVIIYFDKSTQDLLLQRLCKLLRKGGYLFMGHSEILNCNELPVISVAPTVYKRV